MKKKVCYISLPINGHEDTVFERSDNAKELISKLGWESISPIDNNGITKQNIDGHNSKKMTGYYMGRDIDILISECDSILLCEGWENSKGCRVEKFVAETYGLEIFFEYFLKNQ